MESRDLDRGPSLAALAGASTPVRRVPLPGGLMPHALLVDDDGNFVTGLAEVVGREGFTTKTAGTLKEARAELAKTTPDVILVDLHLPDGSGIDLFKDMEGNAFTEVVLITGQASVD